MQLDAIILGAGPAGLAVANAMMRQGAQVKVIEPATRPGGSIRTVREDGWLVETGPNTLQIEGEADQALLNSYGLGTVQQAADQASAQRFILSKGKLHALTNKPSSLFKGNLLTWRGKLRFISEIFRPRGGSAEETVQAFMTRRFGAEAADLLMDPVVSGVHAGDPSRLCMANSFPSIPALEASHRSVILGLIRQPPKGRSIIGFPAGMQQLADAMAAPLRSGALQLGSLATLIRRDARGWNVAWRNAQGQDEGAFAKHLIVTAPHWQWASLPFDEELKKTFREWERAEAPPVTVVARGYDRSAVAHPLDGFGYLIPGKEKRQILGCLFPSTVLPGRTPEGKVLLCCFIGGARYPALARQTDEQLRASVDRELAETLGVSGPPEKEWIQRWDRAIPQYGVDQSRREAALALAEAKNPGLHFHGAFRGGIALMHVIRAGDALGRSLAKG
jgi:oxygen-dependent protoporphyrinogen oxidase